jgi:general secretion pathway protein G
MIRALLPPRHHRFRSHPEPMQMNRIPDVQVSQVSRAVARGAARGFTLIEIMVVVVIIGLLAAVIVPTVISKVDEAREAKAKEDIRALEAALLEFRLDNSKYPTTEQGLAALTTQPTDPSIRHWRPGGYIQRISKDPWGYDYHYENPGTHGKEFDLYTLGADDQPGGDGTNADIGNWNIAD